MAIWQVDVEFDCGSELTVSTAAEFWENFFGDFHELVPGVCMYGHEEGSRIDLCPPRDQDDLLEVIARVDCRDPNALLFCEELVVFASRFDLVCSMRGQEHDIPLSLDAELIFQMAIKVFEQRLKKIQGI